jgi:hypothetical protein
MASGLVCNGLQGSGFPGAGNPRQDDESKILVRRLLDGDVNFREGVAA